MAYRSAEDQNLGEVCNPTMKATLSNRLDSVFVSAHVILQPLRGTPHVMQLEEAMLFGKQVGSRIRSRQQSAGAGLPVSVQSPRWRLMKRPGRPSRECTCSSGNSTWRM